jgi:hypothetical protein
MPVSKKTLYERTLDKNLSINTAAKSLAYFIFREIIEDVHSKYNITQEEMMVMNKKAVNRAAAFLDCIGNDELLSSLVQMLSLETTGWDNPKETNDAKRFLEMASEFTSELHSMKGKTNREIATEQKTFKQCLIWLKCLYRRY